MGVRMTMQTQLILRALLRDPGRELYGLEISAETELMPGTAYPILLRLEKAGWLTSKWEEIDPREEKRPRRRYYRLTGDGATKASAALADARRRKRAAIGRLAQEGGVT